jgi:hypothetical protein
MFLNLYLTFSDSMVHYIFSTLQNFQQFYLQETNISFDIPDDGPVTPKHAGVSGIYNIIVN